MKNSGRFLILFLLLFNCYSLSAQQNTVATGGNASGSGGTVNYSVGQTDYITTTGSGGTALQGVQQPYEIFTATGIEETGIQLQSFVFPNPTENYVTLTINNFTSAFTFFLYDNSGKLIRQQIISSSSTPIELSDVSAGIYFLRIHQNEKEIKSFKIIKNK